ncbi:hypothetical protein HYT84_03155, partial [Candidatus Micrarchaeota archaeon]|nr:hypothetical protein [Candidatus Micrarchaeota archaeon]
PEKTKELTEEFEIPKFEEEEKKPEAFKEEFEIPEIEDKKKELELEKKPEEATTPPPSIPTPVEEKKPEQELPKSRIITEGVKPLAVPPILYKAPEQIARTSFEEIEDKFKQEWAGEKDEIKIKRKMLELTKELFKEKSGDKREELKRQVVTLKNILSKPSPEVAPEVSKKSAKKIETSYSLNLFNTIINSHLAELSSSKDSISSSYTAKIEDLKRRLSDALLSISDTDDAARRKAASDTISNLNSLKQQLPIIISKYQKFLLDKHAAELEKLKNSIDKSDSASIKACEKRSEEIKAKYKDELDSLRDSLLRTIELVIESTNQRLEKKEEKPVPKSELNLSEALFDINNTDEGSMLYYLHSKDPDTYKKYERKHISKYDALSHARKLMAKEKGLSAEQINKYFGN